MNGTNKNMTTAVDSLKIAQENYTEYSKYVAQGRAYPSIVDGLKTSYKRALYGIYKEGARKIQKVAELAAFALPYHPHPTSVSGVIVQMGDKGNKVGLFDTQGNWGNSNRGIQPAADRYIGGKLSNIAMELFCEGVEYTKFVKGEIEKDEPEFLPALLPYCFINGQSGIPAGLPKLDIIPININQMIDYYVAKLDAKDVNFKPKHYPYPNIGLDILSSRKDWESIMTTGKGVIKIAPKMTLEQNTITITGLPESKNGETVYKIIENEILQEKVDFIDLSTDVIHIVIDKVPRKSCDMNVLFKRVYNKLTMSKSCNFAFFDNEYIYVPCGFDKVVTRGLQNLIATHKYRLECQIEDVSKKILIFDVINSMKERGNFDILFSQDYEDAIKTIVRMFRVDENIASAVLSKPISYLTRAHDKELEDLKNTLAELTNAQSDIYEYLKTKYQELKEKLSKYKFEETRFIKQ